MKKLLACVAVAFLAVGCNSDGGNPTDPSQVNVEFSFSDLVVGTGAEAVRGGQATLLWEVFLYNPAGTASKGNRLQGASDPNPQVPGTVFGPITLIVGAGQYIPGFEQGVPGMRVGGKRRVYVPPSMAYGSAGQGNIPPNASIVFELELTSVQ